MREKSKLPEGSEDQPGLRLDEAMRLQEIEGNPLSTDQVEMFEMFDRQGWSHARRRAYILNRALPLAAE